MGNKRNKSRRKKNTNWKFLARWRACTRLLQASLSNQKLKESRGCSEKSVDQPRESSAAGEFKVQDWDSEGDGSEDSTSSQNNDKASKSTKNKADSSPAAATPRTKRKKRVLCCCAIGCINSSDTHLMFIIPKDPVLRRQWITNINRQEWVPTMHSALCQIHFTADCWEQDPEGRQSLLKPTAIPTEYLNGESWEAGPSSIPTKGVNNWTAEQDDAQLMDIEEHMFIKEEILDAEILVKEENDEMSAGETTQGFETVFVEDKMFKDDDTPVSHPHIKVEVEEDAGESMFSSEYINETPKMSGYQPVLPSPGPAADLSFAVTCSSAPTTSVITTFPSSVMTTTVSSVSGLISTVPLMSSTVSQGNISSRPTNFVILRQPPLQNKLTCPPLRNTPSPPNIVPTLQQVPEETVPIQIRQAASAHVYVNRAKPPEQSIPNQATTHPSHTGQEPTKVPPDAQKRRMKTDPALLTMLLKHCYTETELKIRIDLAPLPDTLRKGVKLKIKSLMETIFLKHISPSDIIIAIKQHKNVPLSKITGLSSAAI